MNEIESRIRILSEIRSDKDSCYYKAVAIDAIRAVDFAAGEPEADPQKIVLAGGSEGGGIVLLLSAFHRKIQAVVADIPNMCRMDFGVLNSTLIVNGGSGFLKSKPGPLSGRVEQFKLLRHRERGGSDSLSDYGERRIKGYGLYAGNGLCRIQPDSVRGEGAGGVSVCRTFSPGGAFAKSPRIYSKICVIPGSSMEPGINCLKIGKIKKTGCERS